MFRVLVMMLILCSPAIAEDDSCQKKPSHGFVVECKVKNDADVALVSINGGECHAPAFHKHVIANKSFEIVGTKDCFYVRSVTLTIDGKNKTFGPL